MLKESGKRQREAVPFTVRTADGDSIELTYSSPRVAEEHDEEEVLDSLPWFEPGKPLRNYMLHQTDFYDEVEQIWGRRWGAEGIGTLREVLVSRPTENEIRPEYSKEWQYYYSSAAGNADLGRLQEQFDAYYEVLEENGVRVNYIEPPVPAIGAYGWIKNLVTLAGGGLVVHGGAILHRYGLGSWQRGREVIWSKALAALQVPIYLTIHGRGICEPGAGRWLDAKTFVFNESVVANEEGPTSHDGRIAHFRTDAAAWRSGAGDDLARADEEERARHATGRACPITSRTRESRSGA